MAGRGLAIQSQLQTDRGGDGSVVPLPPFFVQGGIREFLPEMIAAAERTRDRWQAMPPRGPRLMLLMK